MTNTRKPVTRDVLLRSMLANAALKPMNLLVLFTMVAIGMIIGLPMLAAVPVAGVVYLALAGNTLRDQDEQRRVADAAYGRLPAGKTPAVDLTDLPERIAQPLRQAEQQAAGIRRAIESSTIGLEDVSTEVDGLLSAMGAAARRAALIDATLVELSASGSSPSELRARVTALRPRVVSEPDVAALVQDLQTQEQASTALQARLETFLIGQERICVSLGLLRTRIADMNASADTGSQRDLTDAARDLRERTDMLAETLDEVYDGDDLDRQLRAAAL